MVRRSTVPGSASSGPVRRSAPANCWALRWWCSSSPSRCCPTWPRRTLHLRSRPASPCTYRGRSTSTAALGCGSPPATPTVGGRAPGTTLPSARGGRRASLRGLGRRHTGHPPRRAGSGHGAGAPHRESRRPRHRDGVDRCRRWRGLFQLRGPVIGRAGTDAGPHHQRRRGAVDPAHRVGRAHRRGGAGLAGASRGGCPLQGVVVANRNTGASKIRQEEDILEFHYDGYVAAEHELTGYDGEFRSDDHPGTACCRSPPTAQLPSTGTAPSMTRPPVTYWPPSVSLSAAPPT